MLDSVWPCRRQPTRLPHPWDSPGKNTWVGCHCLLHCVKVKSESEVAQSCLTLSDPMDCSLPGSSVHGFSRQEYWSGVPLPSLIITLLSCKKKNSPKATEPSENPTDRWLHLNDTRRTRLARELKSWEDKSCRGYQMTLINIWRVDITEVWNTSGVLNHAQASSST